jgi:hypothetical protein
MPHTVHGKGYAMGATTKSISGLFANICGRNVCVRIAREHFTAGHGTRSEAAQGYLSLVLAGLSPVSWRDRFSSLGRFSRLEKTRDQARWLLKRLGGQLASALSKMSGMFPNTSGILRPVWCPARPRPQAGSRPDMGVVRFGG